MVAIDFTKEPKEVVDYLAKKGLKTTFDYKEMMHEAHHTAFTVAKITNLDLLSDVHESLQSAFKEGKPFKQWRDELTPTLQAKGWLGEVTAINPTTGEVRDIFVGSRRLKNIYQTNMRTAYDRINYKNLMEGDTEYWRYVSLLEGSNRRLKHKKMHGIILPRTHPFWAKNKPRCAWGCQCHVDGYTKEELDARGWKVNEGDFADIADDDWAYDKLEGAYKPEQSYFEKVKGFTCKERNARGQSAEDPKVALPTAEPQNEQNAKIREVLCPFVEAVKEGYRTAMMSLLPKKKEWDSFVDRALDTNIKNHEEMRLGYLSAITGLETYLKENSPMSDLILADTGSIRNLKAKGNESVTKIKKETVQLKNTLTSEDLKKLVEVIHAPSEGYLDEKLMLVYDLSQKSKIVIGVDVGDKHRVYNTLYSGQAYKTKEDLENTLRDKKRIF